MKIKVGAFLGGLVFGVGLAVAGMTQPAKIIGFFDFFGDYDPSLAFVMGGAILVYAPVYRWAVRTWQRPIWAPAFSLPTREDIDARLVIGSGIFGVGWEDPRSRRWVLGRRRRLRLVRRCWSAWVAISSS